MTAHDRRAAFVLLLIALAVTAAGLVPFLAALGVIPSDDSDFGAPRWMVALLVSPFVLVGLALVLAAIRDLFRISDPTLGSGPIVTNLFALTALTFLVGVTVFLHWQLFQPQAGNGVVAVGGIPLPLPAPARAVVDRAMVGLFVLLLDAIWAVGLWHAGREWLRRRRAVAPPIEA